MHNRILKKYLEQKKDLKDLLFFCYKTPFLRYAKTCYRYGIEKSYSSKAIKVGSLSLFFSPLRMASHFLEHVEFRNQIAEERIDSSPIFILGLPRSGTTLLHNALTQDPQFGYLTYYQEAFPKASLANHPVQEWLTTILLAEQRPQDNVKMGADLPAEGEGTLEALRKEIKPNFYLLPQAGYTLFKSVTLPKHIALENLSSKEVEDWKKAFLYFMKIISIKNNHKPLIVKIPENTARIKMILELFPQAKFITIYRNPFDTFASMRALYLSMHKQASPWLLGPPWTKKMAENITLDLSEYIMKKYFEQRSLISPGNLVEIKFEDFQENPLATLEKIYFNLKIPNFLPAHFHDFIVSAKKYEKNKHDPFTQDEIQKIVDRWKFIFDETNYSPTPDQSTAHNKSKR